MLAVRVPPSASITSQSTLAVFSPSSFRSTTARSERPISRWISIVRPPCLPEEASRRIRSWVEAGSMPYSQVTHPPGTFCAFIQGGTFASTLTAQITLVPPHSISTEASG